MKPRQCAGCAAPLAPAEPGTSVRCTVCGLVNDPAAAAPQVLSTAPAGALSTVRVYLPGARLAFLVFFLAILVPVGLMVYSAVRGGESLVRTAADAISAAATTGRTAPTSVTLSDLDDLSPGFHPLEVTPPPSGYESLDAVAVLPWAVTIAQAWADDARLERIDVDRLHPDGVVNVADDNEAEVTYRFVSPERIRELRRRADLSANAQVQTEFWVRVQNGQPTVVAPTTPAALQAFRDHEGLPPEHPRALPLATTFARLATRTEFKAPFYKGYLLHVESEGWVWYFSTLSGQSLPRVRSTDAKAWPYK
jgi:hypothetical protein